MRWVLASGLLLGCVAAESGGLALATWPPGWTKEDKALFLNAGAATGVLAYGVGFWQYGDSPPHLFREGWFGSGTLHGGMDKLGHAYANYLGMTLCSRLYEEFGYAPRAATVLGALSTCATTLLIEVGDSFSPEHGFSPEDVVANGVGVIWGAVRREIPAVQRSVDFRIAYWPSAAMRAGEVNDITSDYAGQRYLLAFKGAAFGPGSGAVRRGLRFLELHLGYEVRGFEPTDDADPARRLYAGIGINLGELLDAACSTRAGEVFAFYQPPYAAWDGTVRTW